MNTGYHQVFAFSCSIQRNLCWSVMPSWPQCQREHTISFQVQPLRGMSIQENPSEDYQQPLPGLGRVKLRASGHSPGMRAPAREGKHENATLLWNDLWGGQQGPLCPQPRPQQPKFSEGVLFQSPNDWKIPSHLLAPMSSLVKQDHSNVNQDMG